MLNRFINIVNYRRNSSKILLYLFCNLQIFHIFRHDSECILNEVQEASSSNLDTRTKKSCNRKVAGLFIFYASLLFSSPSTESRLKQFRKETRESCQDELVQSSPLPVKACFQPLHISVYIPLRCGAWHFKIGCRRWTLITPSTFSDKYVRPHNSCIIAAPFIH